MLPIADDGLKLSLTDISLNRVHPARATPAEIERISPAAWAYLGDAVYELYIRSLYLIRPEDCKLIMNWWWGKYEPKLKRVTCDRSLLT